MPTSEKLQRLLAATDLAKDALNRKIVRPGHLPDLDPDALLPESEACVEQEGCGASIDGFSAGRSAMKLMSESMADIHDAVDASKITRPIPGQISASGKIYKETIVDPARVNEVRAAMSESFGRVARGTDRHIGALDTSLSRVEEAIAGKIRNSRPDVQESADIRRTIFAMPANERFSFVHSQLHAGDLAVAHAVLSVNSWASGIAPKDAALLRELAANQFASAEVKMRDALRTAKSKVVAAQDTWGRKYGELLPAPLNNGQADQKLKALRSGRAS